ncbi:hypothetical protein HK100_006122, partial [Physocladia obscura]
GMYPKSTRSEADKIFDEIDAFLLESHNQPFNMMSNGDASVQLGLDSTPNYIFGDAITNRSPDLTNGFLDLNFNLSPPNFMQVPTSFNRGPFNSHFGATSYCVPTHSSHTQSYSSIESRLSAPRLKFSVPKMLSVSPPSPPTPPINFSLSSNNTSAILGAENNVVCFPQTTPLLSPFSPQPQTPASPSQSPQPVFPNNQNSTSSTGVASKVVLHFSCPDEDAQSLSFSGRFQLPRECTAYLKARFAENQKPHGSQIREFSNQLGIDCKKVQKWFQNRRRRVLKSASKSFPASFNVRKES